MAWMLFLTVSRSPEQITERLDSVIADIRSKFQVHCIGKPSGQGFHGDVLIVAHGHILRSFAARWINKDISSNPSLILEAGGVGTGRLVI
jgi:sedoheptulose-bisphosphatase